MSLTNISPIDGRYQAQVSKLRNYFSEAALIRYRLMIELKYLVALSKTPRVKMRKIKPKEEKILEKLWQNFSLREARIIKEIEKETGHDVKAVEYFIKEKLAKTSLKDLQEFIHFALTSEDVNNLAYSLTFKEALSEVYLPHLEQLLKKIRQLARANKALSLLALTHGQPASPTTLGKELAVFYLRIKSQKEKLENLRLRGKLNGATGNFNAHFVAFPEVDWIKFSRRFVKSFDLEPNPITTQIEPHDSLVEIFDCLKRINSILIDFCQDLWLYISRGVFRQKTKRGEIGSSTMPQKINPIHFENAEGNLGLANAYWEFLSRKLPISRLQRDLTDSTVIRNQGMALAYGVLALKNFLKGLARLEVDKKIIQEELSNHPEVLTEAIQTILRKEGFEKPYEALKKLTRGKKIDQSQIIKFIETLEIDPKEKKRLKKLTPEKYTGLASQLVDLI